MRRQLATLGLAAVLGLTACGGGSSDKGASATTPTSAPTTTALTGNDQAATPFCALARTLDAKLTGVVANLNDKTKLRTAATDADAAITQAQNTAPAEIKADATAVATAASAVLAALRKNDFDVSKTPEIAKLQEAAFLNSFANVNRYARAHCGVS